MKYVHRTLGETADISAGRDGAWRSYIRLTLILACGFVLLNLLAFVVVEIAVRNISVEREAAIFSFMNTEEDAADPDEQEALAPFRQALEKLRAHPDVPPFPYRMTLFDTDAPNAFALPGGTIGITRGLAEKIGDDELAIAFLIGHEMGHFANRDHLRGAGRALIIAGCQSILLPQNDLVGGMTVNTILNSYSRNQEEKADLFGLRLIYDCYGKTDGATRLMTTLHRDEAIPEWAYMFTTHPGPEKRVRLLEEALQKMQKE